jgi:outer membrane protein assembly factor BamB
LDWDGAVVWEKDLGDMHSKHGHGEGASPALYGDTVIVNWDHEGPSFIVALNKRTGAELWKRERDEVSSWSTPIVVQHKGKSQVIVSATGRIRSYDLITGDVIWECGGLSHNVVASPVSAMGVVYAGSSYDTRALLAIRLDGARGDITGSEQVVWTSESYTPYVPSPLLYEDHLYVLRHYQGMLTTFDVGKGEIIYGPVRLPGLTNLYASPVAADGRLYFVDQRGTTLVISHGADVKILGSNHLDDHFNASPAIAGRQLFLRGEKWLYCIERM